MKYLIVGMGNIGDEYANTRHNIGFVVADALAMEGQARFSSKRHASVTKLKYKGRIMLVIKPSTYMNLSGKAVMYWKNKENISNDNLLVIIDDIALPIGSLRIKKGGGDGGHNGLASIIESLETKDFPRLRFGIGNDFAKGTQVDYVLSKWTKNEEETLIPRVKIAVDIVKSFVTIGIERTMNAYNN